MYPDPPRSLGPTASLLDLLASNYQDPQQQASADTPWGNAAGRRRGLGMAQMGLNMMSPRQPQQPGQAPGSSPGQAVNPELAMFGMQRPFWMDYMQNLTRGSPNAAAELGFPLAGLYQNAR